MSSPTCRDCEIDAENVREFIEAAEEHNANPYESLYITPVTVSFGSGNAYDPSDNTFLCPRCRKNRVSEGKELYDDTD